MTLVQAATKSRANVFAVVVLGVDLGVGAEDRVGAEDEVGAGGGPFGLAGLAVADLVTAIVSIRQPGVGHVRQIDEEVIGELAFARIFGDRGSR